MLKNIIALILFSILIILCMPYAERGINLLLQGHEAISEVLTNVFAGGQSGQLAKDIIALLSIPILLSFIPAVIYAILTRRWFPYFMEMIWIIWLVQAGALIMQ